MSKKERIINAYELLRSRGIVHTQQDVAECMKIKKSQISMAFNGNPSYLTESFFDRFNTTFGGIFNEVWLLTGEGEMLKDSTTLAIKETGIPYFENDNFECGTPAGFGGALEKGKASGLMNIPGIKQVANSFLVRAHGISMVNRTMPNRSIPDGAWVALQKCQISAIRWGEVYALATADGFIIKKLIPSEREGYVKCVSFNEQDGYLPFDLRGEEIYDFAIVIGVVNVGLW